MPLIRCPEVCKTVAIPGKYNPATGKHGRPIAAEVCSPGNCMVIPGGPRRGVRVAYPGGPLLTQEGLLRITLLDY